MTESRKTMDNPTTALSAGSAPVERTPLPVRVHDALLGQMAREFESSQMYLSLSAYFEAENLTGFARWMRVQSDEERGHAMKVFDYLADRGEKIVVPGVAEPTGTALSPLDAFTQALSHERKLSRHIADLYALATEERDYVTQSFLQWFLKEQVEEEKQTELIVAQLERLGSNSAGLLALDHRLSKRDGE